jgi:hypothetical protein
MTNKNVTRRDFIGKSTAGLVSVTVSSSASTMSAASYNRIIGANERINIGFLGCGDRSSDHQSMVKSAEKDKNLSVVAVCDIWKLNREKTAANCKKLFGTDIKRLSKYQIAGIRLIYYSINNIMKKVYEKSLVCLCCFLDSCLGRIIVWI